MTTKQLYKIIIKECNRLIDTKLSFSISYNNSTTCGKRYNIYVGFFRNGEYFNLNSIIVYNDNDLPDFYSFIADMLEKNNGI